MEPLRQKEKLAAATIIISLVVGFVIMIVDKSADVFTDIKWSVPLPQAPQRMPDEDRTQQDKCYPGFDCPLTHFSREASPPSERQVVAIVDHVSGENITYREKDGAEQPLRLLTQLHTGDFVYLPDPNDVVQLLVGASHRSIVHRDSPYQVPAFGANTSFLRNIVDGTVRWAKDSVERLWGKEQERGYLGHT